MILQVQRRLFTAAEYHEMLASGVLKEDDRLELIEGEIVEMSPIGPKHAARVDRLNSLFTRKLGERVIVRVQSPIALGKASEPQPDLALLRPRADGYEAAHPKPKDVLLVIEVADTTVDYDRDVKIALYGRAGIAEAWLVCLDDRWVEIYTEPTAAGYRMMRKALPGERIAPRAFPQAMLKVSDIIR